MVNAIRCGWVLVAVLGGLSACAGSQVELDGDESRVNDLEGEGCEAPMQERACGAEDEGMQFCAPAEPDSWTWGLCLAAEEVECMPGDWGPCGEAGDRVCVLDEGEPMWSDCEEADPVEPDAGGEEDTPIVLVMPGETLAFQPAGTATFAIAGECITHDWPTAATPWLALDLDGNGSIDDGRELFGSGTRLRDGSTAANGFSALAELDADGDGLVTPADPRFSELVLWADHDGDRRSTHVEHTPLAAVGITALPVAFHRERTCDDRGNCAIERASVPLETRGAAELVDVHLACQ